MQQNLPVKRRRLVALWFGLVGLYGFFVHGYLENTDAEITLHAARAFWQRGDFGFAPDAPDATQAEQAIAAYIDRGDYGRRGVNQRYYVWFPIGHQLLMVPCFALGDLATRWWPQPAQHYLARHGPVYGEAYWARFFASWLPAIAAAGSSLLLLWIAGTLGCTRRESLVVALVATWCTQFAPGASETVADAPGMFFLLAMAALVLRNAAGRGGLANGWLAGITGGCAVLVRYPHIVPVAILALAATYFAWRRRRILDSLALAVGALPPALLLLAANWLRFGSVTETGYSSGANAEWLSYPIYLGAPMILLAPGKGALWFSPPLLLALIHSRHPSSWRGPRGLALLLFVLPVLLHGHTAGWGAGQCWGIRYVTPVVVLLVAVVFALDRPWRCWPKSTTAVCTLGLLVSLGGILTPYRGQQQLAYEAARQLYPGADQLDNNVNADPRLSPLHTHWIYAGLSLSGRLERGGSANTTEPLFGVKVDGPASLGRPDEDAGFRHWWIVFLAHHEGWPLLPIVLVWWGLTTLCWWRGLGGWLVDGAR